jgi:predicted dehydrogenase
MPSADALPIDREERVFAPGDALGDEIASFLDVVRRGGRPVVSGEDGLAALETALSIGARVRGEPDAGHG